MKYLLTTLLVLSFIVPTVIADEIECVGYNETFDVRVLDAKIRPVEGALIQVRFDRGTSFGPQYFTTKPKETGEDGTVEITINNQGTETRDIDCRIWVNATVGGAYAEKTIEVTAHGPIVDLLLDAYPVDIEVNNQAGNPIEGATVTIFNISRTTDSYGRVKFYSAPGLIDYFASYFKGKEAGSILVSGDTDYEIVLVRHSISIDAVDDQGEPVEATLNIFDETVRMKNGHYETDEVYGNTVEASLNYMGLYKELLMFPGEENKSIVSFDTHAPTIENITTTSIGSRPRLTTRIVDKGEYATGVNPNAIEVTYQILPATGISQWTSATTFVSGLDTFVSDFPEIEAGKIIEFRIEAQDYEGNKVIQTGKFVTTKEEPEDVEEPIEMVEEDQEIPYFYIIIGVILIIVVVYIVRYIMGLKKTEV